MNMQTGKANFTDEDIKEKKSEYQIDKELKYKELSYKLYLKSIEQLNKNRCYVVKITSPEGKSISQYFDVESKLKIAEISSEYDPTSSTNSTISSSQYFQDYKMVKKIMMPQKIILSSPQGDIEMTLKSININPKFAKDEFNL